MDFANSNASTNTGTNTIIRTELYHSGKANNVYYTSNPDYLELEASDRISAGNGEKTDVITGKGIANNTISKAIFAKLTECGIPNHYVGPGSNEASKLVLKADPILLEVIGRFKATGSFVKRYDMPNMTKFDDVFIEYTYKSDAAGDPPICNDAIIVKGLLSKREIGYVEYITDRVAHIIKDFFAQCNGELIDFKIEFGRLPNGQIIVIDEISPDTCRILDMSTGASMDKDRFRKDLGNVAETYAEMEKRVSNLK
jgi:phosphoribosylaminoimidazole-succinocarboxamide synthase